MNAAVARVVCVTSKFELSVPKTMLIDLLNQAGASPLRPIPANARVVVKLPGVSDWSNTELELDEHLVEVTWTTEERADG
jgi:hypothetical protein